MEVELFASQFPIFAMNHSQQVKREKKKKQKDISLCFLLWGYFICRAVSDGKPQVCTWKSVFLGSFELIP